MLGSPEGGASRRSAPPRGCFAPAGTSSARQASLLPLPGGVPVRRGGQARCSSPVGRPPPSSSAASRSTRVRQPSTMPPRGFPRGILPSHPARRSKPFARVSAPARPGQLLSSPAGRNQPLPPGAPPAQSWSDVAAPEGATVPDRNQPGSAWRGTPPRSCRQAGRRAATDRCLTTGKPAIALRPGGVDLSTTEGGASAFPGVGSTVRTTRRAAQLASPGCAAPAPPASRWVGRSVPSSFDQPPHRKRWHRPVPFVLLSARRAHRRTNGQDADSLSLQGFAPVGIRRGPKASARLSRSWVVLQSISGPVSARSGLR